MFKQINNSKFLNNKTYVFSTILVFATILNLVFSQFAFADSLTEEISNQFNNVNSVILALWYGIIGIVGGFTLVSIGKELIPGIANAKKRQSPEFKDHMQNAIIAAVILIVLAILPVIIPLAVQFFSSFKIDFGSFVTSN